MLDPRVLWLSLSLLAVGLPARAEDPSLLLHLTFEDRSAKPLDSSPQPGKAVLVGRAGYGRGPVGESAIALSGGAHVKVSNPARFVTVRDVLTVSLWIRADAFPANSRVIQQGPADACWSLNINFKGELVWEVVGLPPPSGIYRPVPPAGTWVHLACVFDRGKMAYYVDGKLAASRVAGGTRLGGSRDPILIGAGTDREGQAFAAIRAGFDDVRVYARALSAAEIAALAAR